MINRNFFFVVFICCLEVFEYSLVDYIKYVCYLCSRVYKLFFCNKMGFDIVYIFKIICNLCCM